MIGGSPSERPPRMLQHLSPIGLKVEQTRIEMAIAEESLVLNGLTRRLEDIHRMQNENQPVLPLLWLREE